MTALGVFALTALGLVVYSYALYPLLLVLSAGALQVARDMRYLSLRAERRAIGDQSLPNIAVVISAFNEREHIEARIANVLGTGYPPDRLRLYVGSDGSTDGTTDVLSRVRDRRVVARCFSTNRGKASVLNDLVAATTEPVVVFSDANTEFDKEALQRLVRHFSDASVGCVCGELRLRATVGDSCEGAYWQFEQALKFLEARIGGLLGANGGIYAIRRHYWRPLEPDTICDDFCIAMNVAVAGGRLVYDPEALAFEDAPPGISDEYARRVRIGIGNFQALVRRPEYLYRTRLAARWTYISHKVLRWMTPHLMIVTLVTSALQWSDPRWRLFTSAQIVCLGLAAMLYRAVIHRPDPVDLPGWLRAVAHLVVLNVGFLVASVRFATGRYSGSWRRTARHTRGGG